MGSVIQLFGGFDYNYGGCPRCNSDDFKILLDRDSDEAGYMCSSLDCGWYKLFEDNESDYFTPEDHL